MWQSEGIWRSDNTGDTIYSRWNFPKTPKLNCGNWNMSTLMLENNGNEFLRIIHLYLANEQIIPESGDE